MTANSNALHNGEDQLRFRQLINWILLASSASTLIYFVIGGAFSVPIILFMGVGTLVVSGVAIWTRQSLERRSLITLVLALLASIWMLILVFGILVPVLLPAMLIAIILTVALALPYIDSRLLKRFSLAGWVVAIILVVVSRYATFPDPIPHFVADFLIVFVVAVGMAICLFLLWQFHARLTASLLSAQTANSALLQAQASLETQVAQRTAALQTALAEAETTRNQLAEQLSVIAQQREVIREMSVPLLPVGRDTLVLPLVGALDSARLGQLQEQALNRLQASRARRLLLDITGVPVVDSQVAQGLLRVVQAAKMLGAEAVLVGIRPEVAQSIVGLGLDLGGIRTCSDLQGALERR